MLRGFGSASFGCIGAIALFFLDANIIFWTFLVAYVMRFHVWAPVAVREAQLVPPVVEYSRLRLCSRRSGACYHGRANGYSNSLHQVVPFTFGIRRLFTSGVIALGLLMMISFAYRPLLLSRLVYGFAFLGATGLLSRCGFGSELSNGNWQNSELASGGLS